MGITGLIPFIKKASRPANLREFRGQTAAIDAYCWLHKGAFSCADKLVRGEPTDGYVIYMMRQINQLLNHDIKPILVFDGCHLPSKAITETKRRENRERNRKKAKELLREGRTKEAKECFQRCVDVTSEMASDVINACRARNVDIIVAPYEADAQLAYLNLCGLAQLIITEDSDLILFGCKNILFKMDYQGNGILVDQEKLHMGLGVPRDKFVFDKFRNMCILSGCDYLPSLHGIGLAKACKFFNVTSNPDVHNALCKLPSYLKMPQLEVTREYRDGFLKARNTFLYQLVFDPIDRQLKPLTDYPDGMGPHDYPYAGKFIGHDRALQVALGNVNVQTGETVDNFNPDYYKPPEMKSSEWDKKGNICTNHPSMWKRDYTPRKPQVAIPSLGVCDQETTKGKEVIIPTLAIKRKRMIAEEPSTPDITEGELQSMYAELGKKTKVETTTEAEDSEEEGQKDESMNALDLLSEALDEEEDSKETFDLLNDIEESCQKEPFVSPSKLRKSKNPFAKAQSPKKKSSLTNAGQFSALKRFSKIRKTVVDQDTLVHSRYFPSSSSTSSSSGDIKKEPVDPLPSEVQDHKDEISSTTLIECDVVTEKSKDQSNTSVAVIKAPLSPVQTNTTLTIKTEKTFKWGKLTDMFSYKGDKNLEVQSSPAARSSFKSVFTSRSVPRMPVVQSKENTFVSPERSDDPDDPEPVTFSQSSCISEMSIVSDIGSIDNESFGLTPTCTQDSLQSSQDDQDDRLSLSQDDSNALSIAKQTPVNRPSAFMQKSRAKTRSLGLSRPRGRGQKRPDPKQLSLRDMFAFKKETRKLLSTRPSL